MKRFNKVIQIEVSVDNIANKFLKTIDESNPHRELLTEAVIGTAFHSGSLGSIYNALHGFRNDIDFTVGQRVNCTEKRYMAQNPNLQTAAPAPEAEEGSISLAKPRIKKDWFEVGEAEIIEIDEYSEKKVKLRYASWDTDGTYQLVEDWFNHINCKAAEAVLH